MPPLKTLLLLLAMITPAAAATARGDPSAVVPETSPASDEAQPGAVGELLERRAAGSGPAEDTELAQTLMGKKSCPPDYQSKSNKDNVEANVCYKMTYFGMMDRVAEIDPKTPNIPAHAFEDNKDITEVVIPPGLIQKIGDYAFSYTTKLTKVIIPDSVLKIGVRAFYGTPLKTVTIGNKVESIEAGAFYDTQLTAVIIPDSVLKIGDYAFVDTPLKTVTIGKKVQTIGNYAFTNTKLTAVTIPDSVTKIGAAAFIGAPLETVSIGKKVQTIGGSAFSGTELHSVIIPNSVLTIGKAAFFDTKLTVVCLPEHCDAPNAFPSSVTVKRRPNCSV